MTTRFPTPRLLPTTIAFTAVLLVVKCGVLVDAALFDGARSDAAMVTEAKAAGSEPAAKPANHPVAGGTPPSLPAPGKPSAKAEEAKADKAAGAGKAEAPAMSEGERALLEDLRKRRQALDERADALKTREAVLSAAEQKFAARVSEMQALQKKLEALDSAQKQKEEAAWEGMAKLYEAMKPRDAATIFNDLSMPVLLQVLNRMKDPKAAAVMAAMNPDKARDVTAELARLRLGHDPAAAPDGVRSPQAGG